ncbi:Uncharacterized protein TPAR_00335 [Tolypocladium paradoxum]|uniref:Uncharacterized protein n=1 Tax=Tolypocladium paradoxum TaxID=94208 RepID=A0A2S4LAK0_9HYPO|nr:Uncharacterized protein TPAR_00335 [Tolypocladium paradoxum]
MSKSCQRQASKSRSNPSSNDRRCTYAHQCLVGCEAHHSSLLKKPLPPMLKVTVAVRQVICSSSTVYTSAMTVYLPWWNLLGQVDLLGDLHVASFDGAFEVDVADLLAEVRLGRNKSDEAVLDCNFDVGPLLDGLLDSPARLDDQLLASGRRVGHEIHPLDCDDVAVMLDVAVLQGTLSGDLEVLVGDDIGGVAVEDAQRRRRCQAGGQAGDRKPHRVDVETVWRIAAAS